jgi:ABC-type nitrate/sulfonate/bicarbonate transport system permease component
MNSKNAPRSKYLAGVKPALLYSYPLLLVLLAWQAAVSFELVRPLFLPGVGAVLSQFWTLFWSGEIIGPLFASLLRAFAGLVLAVVVGVVVALAMARSKWLRWALDPLISFAFPAPKIAFVPIFILWFGIGHTSKILLVAFTCVLPMLVATYHGATGISQQTIWSAKAMGTSESKLLYRVIFPAALPYIFGGVRVTVPVALITAFTAEMIAGGGGLGGALMYAQRFFQTPTVFVYIVVMLITGSVFDRFMLKLRNRWIPWQDDTDAA